MIFPDANVMYIHTIAVHVHDVVTDWSYALFDS